MKDILILGNGTTRLDLEKEIGSFLCPIWVCNEAYQEKRQLKGISRVGTVHKEMVVQARKFRERFKLDYSIITKKRFSEHLRDKDETFIMEKGWSTGNLLILQALKEEYDRIYLAGFDFGGSDIYQPTSRPGGNFKNQFQEIQENIFPEKKDRLIFLKRGMMYGQENEKN